MPAAAQDELNVWLLWFCPEASRSGAGMGGPVGGVWGVWVELLSSKGKNLRKIIDCHLKYFQMLAFDGESRPREQTLTSDFVGGYHVPQMLVNPQFCLFACTTVCTS